MIQKKIQYPDSQFFVEIKLFDTVSELQKKAKCKDCEAMYRPNGIVVYPKRRLFNKLGTLYFAKGKLGCGLVAHELFHCTLDYAHKKFNKNEIETENGEQQEELAYFQGYYISEIYNWLYEAKII